VLTARPHAPGPIAARAVAAVLLLGAAAGSAVYVVALSVMAHWPSIVRARGTGGAARPAVVAPAAAALGIAGLVVLLTSHRGAHPVGAGLTGSARNITGVACVGFGAAWVVWGLVEQHLFRTFDLAPGAATAGAWDALFHAVGFVAAGVGTTLLSAGGVPGRST